VANGTDTGDDPRPRVNGAVGRFKTIARGGTAINNGEGEGSRSAQRPVKHFGLEPG